MCVSAAQTLTTGLAEQVKRERVRLEVEIKQASDKALLAVHKWYGHNCQHTLKCCNDDVLFRKSFMSVNMRGVIGLYLLFIVFS